MVIKAADACHKGLQLFHGLNGLHTGRICNAEEVLQLADYNGNCDTCGKAGGDSQGDKLDKSAKTTDTQQDKDNACKDRGGNQTVHAVFGNNACNNGGKGSGGSGNLHMAAAEKGDDKACDDGCVDTLFRAYAGGQSQCNGKGKCYDGNNNACHHIGGKLLFVIALHCLKNNGLKLVHFFVSPEKTIFFKPNSRDYIPPVFLCK